MKTGIFFRKAQTPCGKGGIRYLGPFVAKKVSDKKEKMRYENRIFSLKSYYFLGF